MKINTIINLNVYLIHLEKLKKQVNIFSIGAVELVTNNMFYIKLKQEKSQTLLNGVISNSHCMYFKQFIFINLLFLGRYVGSRPIKLRKSMWKNRSLEVTKKKEKEKAALINLLTGQSS